MFQQLSELKQITITISKSEKRSPEIYKQIAIDWTHNFYETTKLFSKEKYILPLNIKNQYSSIHQNFKSIFDYIKNEKDYKSNFYTDETEGVIFAGDYQDVNKLTDKMKQFNRDEVFNKAIKDIEVLRKEIEHYFEKI